MGEKEMKYICLLLLIVLISGCEIVETPCFKIPDSKKDKMIGFVSACIKNANNLVGEDPEDMVSECYNTGIKLFGVQHGGNVPYMSNDYLKVCNERMNLE